jgi:hypothetical protein
VETYLEGWGLYYYTFESELRNLQNITTHLMHNGKQCANGVKLKRKALRSRSRKARTEVRGKHAIRERGVVVKAQ